MKLHATIEGGNGRACVLVAARSRTLADALSHAFEKAGHPAVAASPDDALDVVDGQISTLVVEADGDREAVISFVKTLREQLGDDLDVVLLVSQRGPSTEELVEQTGARGSITRDVDPPRFVKAVLAGCPVPELRPAGRTTAHRNGTNPLAGLTHRQREVLAELLTGGSDAQIATLLGVSAYTVRTHMQNVFLKLGVNTRFEAAAIALQAGLRPPRGPKR